VGNRFAARCASGQPSSWSVGHPVRHAHHPTGAGLRSTAATRPGGPAVRHAHHPTVRTLLSSHPPAAGRSEGPRHAPSDPGGRLAGRPVTEARSITAEGCLDGRIVGPGSQVHCREPPFRPIRPPIHLLSGASVRPAHDPTGQLWWGTTPGPTSVPGPSPTDPPPVIPWSRTTASPTSHPTTPLIGRDVVGDHIAPPAEALARRPGPATAERSGVTPRPDPTAEPHPRCPTVMV
jgi:hypothetical protein